MGPVCCLLLAATRDQCHAARTITTGEFAVRVNLGAGWGDLVRLVCLEATLTYGVGAVGGLLIAAVGLPLRCRSIRNGASHRSGHARLAGSECSADRRPLHGLRVRHLAALAALRDLGSKASGAVFGRPTRAAPAAFRRRWLAFKRLLRSPSSWWVRACSTRSGACRP